MSNQKWITKDSGDKKKHVLINTEKKTREVQVKDPGVNPSKLEKEAWSMMGSIANVTTVDQLLLQMKKYSGTLGDYSAFNSMLIYMQNKNATIVRSANEWKYFGRELKDDARPISVLYPVFFICILIHFYSSIFKSSRFRPIHPPFILN